jgi:hypothetical protein
MYASLLFLLSFLLQLQYDDTQRVGDVAITISNTWRDRALHQSNPEKAKLEQMMRRRGKAPTPDDEFAAQADFVLNLRATIDGLQIPIDYLYSLGYRPAPTVFQSPNFPADRP